MSNLSLLQRLMREREQSVRNEITATDNGEFEEALNRLDREAENARQDNGPLVKIPMKVERCGRFRI